MPRPLADPAGRKVQLTIHLTPSTLAWLDAQRAGGETRSAALERLLASRASSDNSVRLKGEVIRVPGERPAPEPYVVPQPRAVETEIAEKIVEDCRHPKYTTVAGLRRCDRCGKVRGGDGHWRSP